MAKRRKNPPDTIMLLTVAGGAALYLLLRKKDPAAPIAVPPEHAKQVQENLNLFSVTGQKIPVTGVYDEATAVRLVAFADWVVAALKLAVADYKNNGVMGAFSILSAKGGLFDNPTGEMIALKIADNPLAGRVRRSVYDYLFTRPVAHPKCETTGTCHYGLDDQKYMNATKPAWAVA